MKIGARPQSLADLIAIASGAVPQPVFDTLLAAGLARTVMVATKYGLFEELEAGPASSAELARRCKTAAEPTDALLHALEASGYVVQSDDGFALSPMARKWMLESSRQSLRDHMALMYVVWRWLEHYEVFLETGKPLDVHEDLDRREWELYQRGMRSLATLSLDEFVLRTPVPKSPRRMLDVGGSHGSYSAALCRKHSQLRAEILDLPIAVEQSAELVADHGLGDRLVQRAGDARTEDYGEAQYDVILLSNIVHHFDDATNIELMTKLGKALTEGGVVVVQEPFRGMAGRKDQVGALGEFYFAMLSESRTWTTDDVLRWMNEAGLHTDKPVRFLTVPGFGQVTARR